MTHQSQGWLQRLNSALRVSNLKHVLGPYRRAGNGCDEVLIARSSWCVFRSSGFVTVVVVEEAEGVENNLKTMKEGAARHRCGLASCHRVDVSFADANCAVTV
jgi:hypothetical protein